MQQQGVHVWFLRLALILLLLDLVFGVLASLSFIGADKYFPNLPFHKLRPLHVSSVFFWIVTAAAGGVMYYSRQYFNIQNNSGQALLKWHFGLWIIDLAGIFFSYFSGNFGGREYFEYPPVFSIPILAGWLLFAFYFLQNIYKSRSISKPVYIWMWSTGVLFFCLTFIESNLWNIAWFRNNIIRDITIQWKANGAMVGSWNMLIYGSSFYLMQQISGSTKTVFSKGAFFFYFLGFANLLFNWGHHTYVVPTAPWVRYVAYGVSMTEWIVFLSIIRSWRNTLSDARKHNHLMPYRFLLAAEAWIFLNLFLALLMSIPAVNIYTHGTHVTVAHSMGTTIGINSIILFASLFYISGRHNHSRGTVSAFWLTQISLLIFFISLVAAGIVKAYNTTALGNTNFAQVMQQVYPYLNIFAGAGIVLLVGMAWLALILLKDFFVVKKK